MKVVARWLIASIFTFVGISFLGLGGHDYWQGLQTEKWPATPGKIMEAEIETVTKTSRSSGGRKRRRTEYHVKVRYFYEVNGLKFEGNRLQYGYESHDEKESAKTELARYPVGKDIEVYYDPTDAKTSVLVKGSGTSWLALGLGSITFVLGLVAMVYMIKSNRGVVRSSIAGP